MSGNNSREHQIIVEKAVHNCHSRGFSDQEAFPVWRTWQCALLALEGRNSLHRKSQCVFLWSSSLRELNYSSLFGSWISQLFALYSFQAALWRWSPLGRRFGQDIWRQWSSFPLLEITKKWKMKLLQQSPKAWQKSFMTTSMDTKMKRVQLKAGML